jgi:hypothetical protein
MAWFIFLQIPLAFSHGSARELHRYHFGPAARIAVCHFSSELWNVYVSMLDVSARKEAGNWLVHSHLNLSY